MAPCAARYVTAPVCAAPLAAASGASELQGHHVPEPAAAGTQLLGCQLILGSLHTDPSAEIKHPQPGPIPPLEKPPWSVCNAHCWLAGLPACLPSARDEQETGMALPEPTAKPARVQKSRCHWQRFMCAPALLQPSLYWEGRGGCSRPVSQPLPAAAPVFLQ